MAGADDLFVFLDKWRDRWPEWRVAEAFLPAALRTRATAWSSLRQELMDAAWGGEDPRPGEAKLGWWAEELQGWARGAYRHPLGRVLQPLAAPWPRLAQALPALAASRDRATTFAEARAALAPFAGAVAVISQALDAEGGPPPQAEAAPWAQAMVAQRLLAGDPGAIPLQLRARLGAGASAAALRAAGAEALLQDWTRPAGLPRAERIQQAFVAARLRACAAGGDPARPLPAWRALPLAWQAARRSVPPA